MKRLVTLISLISLCQQAYPCQPTISFPGAASQLNNLGLNITNDSQHHYVINVGKDKGHQQIYFDGIGANAVPCVMDLPKDPSEKPTEFCGVEGQDTKYKNNLMTQDDLKDPNAGFGAINSDQGAADKVKGPNKNMDVIVRKGEDEAHHPMIIIKLKKPDGSVDESGPQVRLVQKKNTQDNSITEELQVQVGSSQPCALTMNELDPNGPSARSDDVKGQCDQNLTCQGNPVIGSVGPHINTARNNINVDVNPKKGKGDANTWILNSGNIAPAGASN